MTGTNVLTQTARWSQLQVACPYCEAKPRKWCKTQSGAPASVLHHARLVEAYGAGVMPWDDPARGAR